MKFDPFKHHRHSIRLRGYDYSQAGAYFITICMQQHQCLFGDVVNAEMDLNDLGMIANECWLAIPEHFPNVELDAYVVMPNHVHGIVVIMDDVGAAVGATHASPLHASPLQTNGPKPNSLGAIIGSYKSAVSKQINELRGSEGAKIWQCNYHDHIIRHEREWNAIAKYIYANPASWNADIDHPSKFKKQAPLKTADDYWRDAGL